MSDTKLRELERRWKETGSVEAEAAYLLERVRVGDLTTEHLEVAAYIGHRGANRAVSVDQGALAVYELVRGLQRWSDEVVVRAGLAAAKFALEKWQAHTTDTRPLEAIEATEAWLACPCDDHKNSARQASVAAHLAKDGALTLDCRAWGEAAASAARAASAAGDDPETVVNAAAWAAEVAAAGEHAYTPEERDVHPFHSAVKSRIRSALLAWARI